MSRTYGKAQDLIDFTRASSGTALRRVKYGAELVTNGGFDTDSDWTLGTGWSISGGKLVGTSVPNFTVANQSIALEAGKLYQLTIVVSESSGGTVRAGFLNGTTVLATDNIPDARTVTANVIALTGNDKIFIGSAGSGFTGSIDSISLKEVTFDTSDGDLILFNHPNNIPRIEYDANGNLLGLLVEESRTNVIEWSNDFSQWDLTRATITSGAAISPDGTQNATLFTATDDDARIQYSAGNINNVNTASIWVKSATGSDVAVQMDNGGLDIDLFTATTEWQRLENILSTTGVTGPRCRLRILNSGDALYIYHGQLEAGGFMTSAIPTSGSTATRSADVASLSTSAFGYNQDKGTVLVEVDVTTDQSGGRIFNFDSGSDANMLAVFISGDYLKIYNRANSTTSVDNALNADKTNTKVGYSFKDSYFIGAQDGTLYATNTTAPDVANDINVLNIMRRRGSTDLTTGHIKSLKYYPRALTVGQIEELTS